MGLFLIHFSVRAFCIPLSRIIQSITNFSFAHNHMSIVPFHTVRGVLEARILKWSALPLSSGPRFVRTLHRDPSILGDPPRHGSRFHWARQGCGPCDQISEFSVTVVSILSALWWISIKGLWKLPDGRDWLWRNLSLALMVRAMLSKSLIWFFLLMDGVVFPLCNLAWGETMVGATAVKTTSFKRAYVRTVAFSAPDPMPATADPHVCWTLRNSSWVISNPKRWCCESAALNMPANLENSAVATGLEKVNFQSNPKERQCPQIFKLPHNCTHLTH